MLIFDESTLILDSIEKPSSHAWHQIASSEDLKTGLLVYMKANLPHLLERQVE